MNIKEFRSEINSNGILLPTKFLVEFSPPPSLKKLYPAIQNQLSLRCEQIWWPGVSFSTMDSPPRLGYGASETIPFTPIFEDISMNFIVDEHANIHKFFFDWMNSIVNLESRGQSLYKGSQSKKPAFEVGYKNEYVTDIHISVYRENGTSQEFSPMKITLYRAFPRILNGYQLDWAGGDQLLKLSAIFTYTDYFVDYQQHNEKPHGLQSHDSKLNSH
jgi:hypothetical protein